MAVCFSSILAIVLSFFSQVLGSGVFEIDLHHFHNSRGLLASGQRCGMTGCRTYFRVCLKNFQTVVSPGKCLFGTAATPVLGSDSFSIQEDARLRLPLNFTWPGAFSLVIEAWHSPAAGDTNDPELLISSFAIQRKLAIGSEWIHEAQREAQTELRYSYRFICKENYYGDTCSKICVDRDDRFGHYTCKPDGQISCRAGWKGDYCQEPICLEGCNQNNGNCTSPGECRCRKGWQGVFCDVCKVHPSCKHGTCSEPWQCNCSKGWGGIFCDQDLNYCTHHRPCANGATCMNTGQGSYTCACQPGFTGVNCDLEVRRCDSQPCHNGGRCLETETGYRCECPQGFEGTHCEGKSLVCSASTCFHGGRCKEREDGHIYICECPPGYTGLNCEKKLDKCTSLKCTNGGHCVIQGNRHLCSCRSGFTGLRCEININECAQNPCANGSTCIDGINEYTCACTPGFRGHHCDQPTDRCASWTCLNGGTCMVGARGQPWCSCTAQFNGSHCQSSVTTPSPNTSWNSSESFTAVSFGVGFMAVLLLVCIVAMVLWRVRKGRSAEPDSENMNNQSKADFQKENLISTLELKNTNKKVELETDSVREKSNQKHINQFQHMDFKSSPGYMEKRHLLDKDENCEKIEHKNHLSDLYRDRQCQISTICPPRDSIYQSVFVIAEEKNECIIATEV
ncbi:delta-like protein 4 [Synchiropus picturatus]